MPSCFARIILFVSSYAPLFVLFALLDSFGVTWVRVAWGMVAATSLIALALYWVHLRSDPDRYEATKVVSASPRTLDVIGYFVSYVIPFAAMQQPDAFQALALALMFLVIAGIYFRNDLYYANPVLALCGIRVFDVTVSTLHNDSPEKIINKTVIVLTHRRFLPQSGSLKLLRIGSYIYLDSRSD